MEKIKRMEEERVRRGESVVEEDKVGVLLQPVESARRRSIQVIFLPRSLKGSKEKRGIMWLNVA
jgi:hypothetical protein